MTSRVQFNIHSKIETSINRRTQNGWFIMENPMKLNIDDFFWVLPTYTYLKNLNETMVDVGKFHMSSRDHDHMTSVSIHHGMPVTMAFR